MKYSRIFLVGFRTVGKTTLGKILADKLKWSLMDTDFLITQHAGKTADVLTNNGADWSAFREIENEVLAEVSKMEETIISCGGGVGVNDVIDKKTGKTFGELNKEIMDSTKDGLVVLLTSNENSIKERLKRQYKNKKIMPFLNPETAKNMENEKDVEAIIEKQIADSLETYKKREPLYEKLTNTKINTDKQSLEKTAEEIISYVR